MNATVSIGCRIRCLLHTGLVLTLGACGQPTGPPVASSEPEPGPTSSAWGILHRIMSEGVQTSALESDTLFEFADENRWDLVGVRMTFNNEQGLELGRLTALTGERDLLRNTFVARGNVVLVGGDADGSPWRLETEELHYTVNEDRVWTDGRFTLREGTRTTHGCGFLTDSRLSGWEVIGARTGGIAQCDTGGRF